MVNRYIRHILAFCITGTALLTSACLAVERDNSPVGETPSVRSTAVPSENVRPQPKRVLRIQRLQSGDAGQQTGNVNEAPVKYRSPQIQAGYAAIVNGEVITVQQLNRAVDQALRQLKEQEAGGYVSDAPQITTQSTRREILHSMIESVLIAQEARKMGVVVQPALVDRKIREIRAGFPSDELFRQALAEEGIDTDTLEKGIRHQLLTDEISRLLAERIDISEDMIKQFYEQNKTLFESSEVLRVSKIVVGSRVEADALLQKLKKGKQSFAELRQKFSLESNTEMGAEELIERDDVPQEIEDRIFSLAEGQVSPVAHMGGRYVIYKVLEKKQGVRMSQAEIKKRTVNYLRTEQQQNAFYLWLSEIRDKAEIVINESLFPQAAPTKVPSMEMQQDKQTEPRKRDFLKDDTERDQSLTRGKGSAIVG